MFKPVDPKQSLPKMEEAILKFWEENKIFDKSVKKEAPKGDYVFYDGPPFITGLPHYATLLPSMAKDVVPRYWTMKGYRVERVWGWDCHGLPAENKVEEQLKLKNKKDIEKLGVGKFIDACRSYVSECSTQWKWYIDRIGRWVDMGHAYRTMDLKFMESVIWAFKELYDKGLIYEGYRSSLHCPRCATPLSKFEITMDAGCYRDVTDTSAVVKFKLKSEEDTYLLAWTTTPWTLPGNLALAVNKKIKYAKIKYDNAIYILAKERVEEIFKGKEYEIIGNISGKELASMSYDPVFDLKNEEIGKNKNAYKVYFGDFVTTEDGTGIVHVAPNFGEDDFELGKKYELPTVELMDENGIYSDEAGDWSGYYFKKANKKVLDDLEKTDKLLSTFEVTHSYPFCYRCNTALIYKTQKSWYLKISEIRQKLIKSNEAIKWMPEYFKEGRFRYNLENAPDWSLSRSRYWGSPVPVWKCEKCSEVKIAGSIEEIEKLSGQKIKELHRPDIDKVEFKCEKCEGVMKRVPEVLDCWFESGAMPFAQFHYPFEKKGEWDKLFPADFIVEYTGQLRGWFYYLHVLANSLFNSIAFKNVIVTGVLAGTDGRKMSKSFGNYPDPKMVLEKYGADALRFYFMSSPIMSGDDMSMSEKDLDQVKKGMFRMLWNTYSFFVLYANIDKFEPKKSDESKKISNLLDRWIVSELHSLIKSVNQHMENYELNKTARLFPVFIDNLSNWYIRRSRKRFWKSESDSDKKQAYETLHYVLVKLAKLMAPFTPFISEEIYCNLTSPQPSPSKEEGKGSDIISVHLADFPKANEKFMNSDLNEQMLLVRRFVKLGLAARAKAGIKVRQPLSELQINQVISDELNELIKDEVNVKKISFLGSITQEPGIYTEEEGNWMVGLNIAISEDLRLEGEARELIRRVQELRKKVGYAVDNRIMLCYQGGSEIFKKFGDLIAKETLADGVFEADNPESDISEFIDLETVPVKIWLKKI
jgi:isoleucyl-tRNA synthetase